MSEAGPRAERACLCYGLAESRAENELCHERQPRVLLIPKTQARSEYLPSSMPKALVSFLSELTEIRLISLLVVGHTFRWHPQNLEALHVLCGLGFDRQSGVSPCLKVEETRIDIACFSRG